MFSRFRASSRAAVAVACAVAAPLGMGSPAAAQTEAAVKSHFEGNNDLRRYGTARYTITSK